MLEKLYISLTVNTFDILRVKGKLCILMVLHKVRSCRSEEVNTKSVEQLFVTIILYHGNNLDMQNDLHSA
jgi:hypothetical protein